MFSKENWPGIVLLVLCVAVCGVMLYGLVAHVTWRYTGPEWLTWVLGALFLGGLVWGWTHAPGRWVGGPRPPWRRDGNGG